MQLINRYIFRHLVLATAFVATVLTLVVWLTQSLRFLELIVSSGAPFSAFLQLAVMTIPRFLEVVLPISVMVAILFVYNKAIMDSELVVLRAAGVSQGMLARPGIMLALLSMLLMMLLSFWVAPISQAKMLKKREVIRAEFSALLLREGVFNDLGSGLTVYLRKRDKDGQLHGILIHDARENRENPVTITARRGHLSTSGRYPTVVVFDGNRAEFDPQTKTLSRLDFSRYTLEVTDLNKQVRQRWPEPGERTLWELFHPNMEVAKDVDNLKAFRAEAHRRMSAPFLVLSFALTGLVCLLLGPLNRQGQARRVLLAAAIGIVLQGGSLALANLARQNDWAIAMMYGVAMLPSAFGLYLLGPYSEATRRRILCILRHLGQGGGGDIQHRHALGHDGRGDPGVGPGRHEAG